MANQKVTILLDDKPGHRNQALSLAGMINNNYKIIELEYNILSLLPPIFLGASDLHIKNNKQLKNIDADIIISCGRRTSQVARSIKKAYNNIEIINILWPEIGAQDFDLIICPEHDILQKNITAKNICKINGSITNITPALLDNNLKKWQVYFNQYTSPYISLIIGGNTKSKKLTLDHAKEILSFSFKMADQYQASILCSFSRRTPANIKDYFNKHLATKHYIYDPVIDNINPYIGLLAISDTIITTGDSISICVDACSSGKKVYIYDDDRLIAKKHRIFLNNLFKLNYALRFYDFDKNNIKCLNNNDAIMLKLKEQNLC